MGWKVNRDLRTHLLTAITSVRACLAIVAIWRSHTPRPGCRKIFIDVVVVKRGLIQFFESKVVVIFYLDVLGAEDSIAE